MPTWITLLIWNCGTHICATFREPAKVLVVSVRCLPSEQDECPSEPFASIPFIGSCAVCAAPPGPLPTALTGYAACSPPSPLVQRDPTVLDTLASHGLPCHSRRCRLGRPSELNTSSSRSAVLLCDGGIYVIRLRGLGEFMLLPSWMIGRSLFQFWIYCTLL
jgi:hypothetical protein